MEMKYYKDSQDNIFAYAADGSQDSLIGNKKAISKTEADNLIAAKSKANFDQKTYAEKRQFEYPPIGDQLDALWKGGAEAASMLEQIKAVKAKYPK